MVNGIKQIDYFFGCCCCSFNNMNYYDDIPTNKSPNVILDFDKYIADKLQHFKSENQNKYKESYLESELQKLKTRLEKEKDRFEIFLTPLLEDFKNGKRQMKRVLYGPNVEYVSDNEKRAWSTFRHILESKGYTWSTTQSESRVCDVMEGWCNECVEYITIR